MNTTNERPTPETDAELTKLEEFDFAGVKMEGNFVSSLFARKLERERGEGREQLKAMRSAIKEAYTALNSDALWAFDIAPPTALEARRSDGKGPLTSGPNNCRAFFEMRKSALAKLQPFLKP